MATAAPDLIKRSCDMLGLPTTVTCTALAFHHALKAATFADAAALELRADESRTGTACIFLAAKVLEAPLRTNDLSNVVLYLLQSSEALQSEAAEAQMVGAGVQQTQHAQDRMVGDGQQQQQQRADHHKLGQQVPVEPLSRENMLVGDAYYEHKRLLIQASKQSIGKVLATQLPMHAPLSTCAG